MRQATLAERGEQSGELEARSKHNLPAPLTSLIGREREITTVQQLLRHPEVAWVKPVWLCK